MLPLVENVKDFHRQFGHEIGAGMSHDLIRFRSLLVHEEWQELNHAMDTRISEDMAGEAADLVYVVVGLCIAVGIDFERAWNEVHRANMEKIPLRDDTGRLRPRKKPTKPEGWRPPDLTLAVSGVKHGGLW